MKRIILILFLFTPSNSAFADTKMKLGLEVYNDKATCGSCHSLQVAESDGNIGPDLDQLKPSMDRIIHVVTNGIGVMPPWKDILSREEIEAVAYYIFNSTNK